MRSPDGTFSMGMGLDPAGKKALAHADSFSFQYDGLRLTVRETQCLAYLILGMTAKQIAKVLSISPRTAEDYITFLKTKFHCAHRYQIVTKALRKGFPIDEYLYVERA